MPYYLILYRLKINSRKYKGLVTCDMLSVSLVGICRLFCYSLQIGIWNFGRQRKFQINGSKPTRGQPLLPESGMIDKILCSEGIMQKVFRILAVIGTYVSIHFFAFWFAGALLFPANNSAVLLISVIVAAVSSGLVWRFWPKSKDTVDNHNQVSEPNFKSRIVFCSILAGSIGFAGGFFGPMLLSPKSNQGPLLGILFTGPIGVLSGPAIGVATLVRKTNLKTLPMAWRYLAVSWLLACGFYTMSATCGVGMMTLTLLVGAALVVHSAKSLHPPKAVTCNNLIMLIGGAAMLFMSMFPPVVKPWWGEARRRTEEPLPSFASIFDAGFDASYHVPLYAINRQQWIAEILITLLLMGMAYLAFRQIYGERN